MHLIAEMFHPTESACSLPQTGLYPANKIISWINARAKMIMGIAGIPQGCHQQSQLSMLSVTSDMQLASSNKLHNVPDKKTRGLIKYPNIIPELKGLCLCISGFPVGGSSPTILFVSFLSKVILLFVLMLPSATNKRRGNSPFHEKLLSQIYS